MEFVKIRDDIDLKELENLGFREIEEKCFANPGCADCYIVEDGIVGIMVDKYTRRIDIALYNEDYTFDDLSPVNLAKIFYKLTQMGLIEGGQINVRRKSHKRF